MLPNGWHVCHSSPAEAAFIYEEIFEERCYIQHGILVRDGDICVDVGANIGATCQASIGAYSRSCLLLRGLMYAFHNLPPMSWLACLRCDMHTWKGAEASALP